MNTAADRIQCLNPDSVHISGFQWEESGTGWAVDIPLKQGSPTPQPIPVRSLLGVGLTAGGERRAGAKLHRPLPIAHVTPRTILSLIPNPKPGSVEKPSSRKPVPGAKKAGDHCSKGQWGVGDSRQGGALSRTSPDRSGRSPDPPAPQSMAAPSLHCLWPRNKISASAWAPLPLTPTPNASGILPRDPCSPLSVPTQHSRACDPSRPGLLALETSPAGCPL